VYEQRNRHREQGRRDRNTCTDPPSVHESEQYQGPNLTGAGTASDAGDADPVVRSAPSSKELVRVSLPSSDKTIPRGEMRRHKLTTGALLLLMAPVAFGACSSSAPKVLNTKQALAAGNQLATRVIPAPYGYSPDTTAGATGTMTAAVFDQAGGSEPAAKAGFVVGYKQNYINADTSEGISVTLIQFSSPADATSYFQATAPRTLSFAAATSTPFAQVPGAIAYAGTKEYGGEYAHGVAMTNGKYYALVVYANVLPGSPPIELYNWAKGQYQLLSAKV
jgi:hypothetical protein